MSNNNTYDAWVQYEVRLLLWNTDSNVPETIRGARSNGNRSDDRALRQKVRRLYMEKLAIGRAP